MARLLIDDGWTITKTMTARNGWPDVTFVYRPATPERTYAYALAPTKTAPDWIREVTKLLTEHLVSWDVEGKKEGDTAEISAATLKQCPRVFLDYMVECVCGYTPEDRKN